LMDTNWNKWLLDENWKEWPNTNQPFGTPVNVWVLQASIPNRRRVYKWGNFRHILKTEFVEHVGILVLERRQINVFLDVLVFRPQLAEAS
jgi:hypothetical protein